MGYYRSQVAAATLALASANTALSQYQSHHEYMLSTKSTVNSLMQYLTTSCVYSFCFQSGSACFEFLVFSPTDRRASTHQLCLGKAYKRPLHRRLNPKTN
jgi:hypothetical protein